MIGIKDGLGILTSIMRSDGIQYLEKKRVRILRRNVKRTGWFNMKKMKEKVKT